jgi:hypothetical protein
MGSSRPFRGGPLLHIAYAACADRIRVRAWRPRWLAALALVHYAALVAIGFGLGADSDFGGLLDDYLRRSFRQVPAVVLSGIAVFVAWRLWLAAGALMRTRA